MSLSTSDIRAALGVLDAVHSAASADQVPPLLAEALTTAIPHDYLVWGQVDAARSGGIGLRLAGFPAGLPLPGTAAVRGYLLAHPGTAVQLPHQHGLPARWSDDLSQAQHRRVPYYSDVIGSLGAEHGATFSLPVTAGRLHCINIARSGSDFSDRDMAMLTALQPYLTSTVARRPGQHRAAGTLTARETAVLGLVSQGLTNYQIARRLAVSPRTVEKHIEHILAKLGVQSRAAAAARYATLHVIP